MSEKHNKLEIWIAEKLKRLDPHARPTKASGASTELGDVKNNFLYVEAKEKHAKVNIIIDYKKEWLKLISSLPLCNKKLSIIVTENKHGEKFVTMNADEFFELLYEAKEL